MSRDLQSSGWDMPEASPPSIALSCATERIEISGDVDLRTTPTVVRAALAYRGTPDLTIDLASVRFIDAAGVNGLVTIYSGLGSAHRSLRVTGASRRIARTFTLAGAAWLLTGAGRETTS